LPIRVEFGTFLRSTQAEKFDFLVPTPSFPLPDDTPEDATPIDQDQLAALIPSHIATIGELNSVEATNIAMAQAWLVSRRRTAAQILNEPFLRQVHRRMFGDVWRWAGKYRLRPIDWPADVGAPPWRVAGDVTDLCADASLWLSDASQLRTLRASIPTGSACAFSDEDAARFHHRLVVIHPFPNGNGRHARLVTDAILHVCGGVAFSWGSTSLQSHGSARAAYIAALRKADSTYDVSDLVAFARS
jgi:Fic-DOC domain mobile mystery protein B